MTGPHLNPEREAELRADLADARSADWEELSMPTDDLDALLAALDAERERVAAVEAERDEAYKRVGQADAQRMVALRKNEERIQELERAEAERDALRAGLKQMASPRFIGGRDAVKEHVREVLAASASGVAEPTTKEIP